MLTMQEQRERTETTVVAFDPHALAMALQLADLRDTFTSQQRYISTSDIDAARWLRSEVQKELESQP